MSASDERNLKIFTLLSSIWGTIMGLIGPFYVVYVSKLSGGMEKMGLAFAITIIIKSTTSYIAGKYSDKLGRKGFLFASAYMDATILLLYTVINDIYMLYIVQAALGISGGIMETIEVSLLGDFTKKAKRGQDVGKFSAIVGLSTGVGLFIGGYLAKLYGIKSLFYFASAVIALSTILLVFIKEENPINSRREV